MDLTHKNWYVKANSFLMSRYSDDIFLRLVSATSPRKNVKANLTLAEAIYHNYLLGQEAFKNVSGVLPNIKANVERALKGKELQGEKVKAFYKALSGDLNAVVIDVWMKRALKVPEDKALTPKQYKALSIKIKKNARKLGLLPAEYQACVWQDIRLKAGFKPVNYCEG